VSSNELPATWTVTTELETVSAPLDIGQTVPRSQFARLTTLVRNSKGVLVAASGDRQDAINQALSICQQTDQPYESTLWTHA
jgi:hypothetical protein